MDERKVLPTISIKSHLQRTSHHRAHLRNPSHTLVTAELTTPPSTPAILSSLPSCHCQWQLINVNVNAIRWPNTISQLVMKIKHINEPVLIIIIIILSSLFLEELHLDRSWSATVQTLFNQDQSTQKLNKFAFILHGPHPTKHPQPIPVTCPKS